MYKKIKTHVDNYENSNKDFLMAFFITKKMKKKFKKKMLSDFQHKIHKIINFSRKN